MAKAVGPVVPNCVSQPGLPLSVKIQVKVNLASVKSKRMT